MATLSTATGNEVFGSVLISPALLTHKQTNPTKQTNIQTNIQTNKQRKKHIVVFVVLQNKYDHML
jgi:hypothetical protein